MDRQPEMRTHPGPHHLGCEGIRRLGRQKNRLHACRGGCPQERAEVAGIADRVGDQDKIERLRNRDGEHGPERPGCLVEFSVSEMEFRSAIRNLLHLDAFRFQLLDQFPAALDSTSLRTRTNRNGQFAASASSTSRTPSTTNACASWRSLGRPSRLRASLSLEFWAEVIMPAFLKEASIVGSFITTRSHRLMQTRSVCHINICHGTHDPHWFDRLPAGRPLFQKSTHTVPSQAPGRAGCPSQVIAHHPGPGRASAQLLQCSHNTLRSGLPMPDSPS